MPDDYTPIPAHLTSASPDGLPPLRDVMRTHGLDAKKSLGQNFILDLNLTRAIARLAGPLGGVTVVEVGPGPGGLTRALLIEGADRVVAVERDDRCLAALSEVSAHYPNRLQVHGADALRANWPALVGSDPVKAFIIANLPYGIATQLLIDWLETEPWPPWWSKMALMFQKEVAERIVAEPGSKAYGRLSVISQYRTTPRIAMSLPPGAFTPPPKVSSAVVVFDPKPAPEPGCSIAVLGKVTAAAFGQRRKMLRSSLKQLTPMPELLLKSAGIEPTRRAEELTVAEFATLARLFGEMT
jgi:16S rRNA (adenine1518-N6/adenine1519-N6)-dimethyltransferase